MTYNPMTLQRGGLKAQKPIAQGKANLWADTLGELPPRMVRPWKGQKPKQYKVKTSSFLLLPPSGAHLHYQATQGAVPAELALGYRLVAPMGRLIRMDSQNLKTSQPYNL